MVSITASLVAGQSTSSPPAEAIAAGYTVNTFSPGFSSRTVDFSNTSKSGYSWYLYHVFGSHAKPSQVHLNSDKSITLNGVPANFNGQIATAAPAMGGAGFVGTAFGDGGYIEAEFKFNPDDVGYYAQGWPSFWALPVEGSIRRIDHWDGEVAGFIHSVEVDFFEYLFFQATNKRGSYGAGMHEWYGVYQTTCPKGFCQERSPNGERVTPTGTDFSRYHRYGFLWKPATPSVQGYGKFFFDGTAIGSQVSWAKFISQPPPPIGQRWAFGRIDQQHLVLFLGTGVDQPMMVRSVNVWQRSATQNLQR